MKTEKLIIIGLWALIAIGVIFAALMLYETQAAPPRAVAGSTVLTGTTGSGDVEVSLTPQGIAQGHLSFAIALNTHSVDLSPFDLGKIAVLEYKGKQVYADSAPRLGGHHVNGILAFPVDGEPTSYTVTITGIPKEQQRVFSW